MPKQTNNTFTPTGGTTQQPKAGSNWTNTPPNTNNWTPTTNTTNWTTNQQVNNMNTEAGQFTTKDLGTVQDQLHQEAIAYKKCSLYSQYFTDPQLKDVATKAAQHHKQHFDALQNYLNSHQ